MKRIASVLVVDDDSTDLFIAERMLSRSGRFDAIEAVNSGDKALEYLERGWQADATVAPTVILLDINMPGLDGFDVLDRLRVDNRANELSVVMLTSSAYGGDKNRADAYAVVKDFLVKPLTVKAAELLADRFGTEPRTNA